MHDATPRALAHRLEPYSSKLADEGPRASILLIPSTLSIYIRRGSEGSQKPFSWLSEVYSPLLLKLVSRLVSPTSTSSGHHVHVVGGAGQCRLDLSLVTFVVTLG